METMLIVGLFVFAIGTEVRFASMKRRLEAMEARLGIAPDKDEKAIL